MATSTEAGSTSQSMHDTESASSVALSSRDDSASENGEDDGTPKLTTKWLLAFFSKDWKHYYRTFELNERLYLHFKGFSKIQCMENFPHLKTLYFEGNGLSEISGLGTNSELRSLYLHENCVAKMEGLDNLTLLSNLNLSDNLISTIENLENLESLDVLYLARNRVGRNGLDDLKGLLACPTITTLDLQNNKIDDPECLEEIFVKMPNLKVLYLQNNGCVNKIKNYRKTVISRIPSLKYLDDRPVFDDDRRNAEAFARGGMEEERAERQRIQEEKRAKDERNRKAFKDMIKTAREEKRLADEKAAAERSASPAEGTKVTEEVVQEEEPVQKIETCEEVKAVDDDTPPELETVDAEKLKEEQAAKGDKEKSQRQLYDQMRDNIAKSSTEDDDESCTIEEVKDEPEVVQPAQAEKKDEPAKDELVSMAEMIAQIEPEQEFVSNLEELD